MASNGRRQPRPSHRSRFSQAFYTPFKDLDQHLGEDSPIAPEPLARDVPEESLGAPELEEAAFLSAMADVSPLERGGTTRIQPAPPVRTPPRFREEEDLEAYRHLVRLVNGEAPFDLWYSDEYVDGAVVGLSPGVMKKLRDGAFSYQEHLDLHGCKTEDAHHRVEGFIRRSFAKGRRCVLIVPGRGLNSRERRPILKQKLVEWLTRAPLGRMVMAFASARSYDGGAGALYVLLRRNECKAPFKTPAP